MRDAMGDDAVARLIEQTPELESVFDEAVGYAVVDMRVTKVPLVGAGGGNGVVVDKRDGSRSYVQVRRLDLGGGYGARSFKMVLAFTDGDQLEKLASGKMNFDAGAEASAGGASADGGASSGADAGFTSYVLAEGGASATVTVRAIRIKPDLK